MQEEVDISHYIRNAIYLYECGVNRLKWYKLSGEKRHLEDSISYIDSANVYMREIKNENS